MYVAETNVGFTPVFAKGGTRSECLRNLVLETEKLVNWKEDAKINVKIQCERQPIERKRILVTKYK